MSLLKVALESINPCNNTLQQLLHISKHSILFIYYIDAPFILSYHTNEWSFNQTFIIICYDNMIKNIRDSEETEHCFRYDCHSHTFCLTDNNISGLPYISGDEIVKYHKLLCFLPHKLQHIIYLFLKEYFIHPHQR
ncbi:hypothetical protein V8G54_025576 [Vigna mungo]|uniref:Uncharacterized protein n=1 Tax=Vigna mungo TaxID=3915 RepID=A0AAQ3RMD4_VIGMU